VCLRSCLRVTSRRGEQYETNMRLFRVRYFMQMNGPRKPQQEFSLALPAATPSTAMHSLHHLPISRIMPPSVPQIKPPQYQAAACAASLSLFSRASCSFFFCSSVTCFLACSLDCLQTLVHPARSRAGVLRPLVLNTGMTGQPWSKYVF
jgi:hypothetical protein